MFALTTTAQVALPDSITEATASVHEIARFMKQKRAQKLSTGQLLTLRYAFARALYREMRALSVDQLALLMQISKPQVENYIRRLKVPVENQMVSNDGASRVMCAQFIAD